MENMEKIFDEDDGSDDFDCTTCKCRPIVYVENMRDYDDEGVCIECLVAKESMNRALALRSIFTTAKASSSME